MLEDIILEAHGKVTAVRLLPDGRLEHVVALEGELLGERFLTTLSTTGGYKSGGATYAEFQGSVSESGFTISYEGIGNGMKREGGLVKYKGAICFFSNVAKFSRLNGIAVLWEAELNDDGTIRGMGWEWK